MKRISAFLLIVISFVATANDSSGAINSTTQIPKQVLKELEALCSPCSFADFGAPWEATDVIRGDLPRRRLTHVNLIGSRWHIEYEHGGRGKHLHTVIINTAPKVQFEGGSCDSPNRLKCEW